MSDVKVKGSGRTSDVQGLGLPSAAKDNYPQVSSKG